jgi:molybdopterin converting factor small subunit
MTVTVVVPTMLAQLIGGERKHAVEAGTVGGAIEQLLERHPELRVHLFDEDHTLRPHLRCFLDGAMITDLSPTIEEGAVVTLLQAVSGGRR